MRFLFVILLCLPALGFSQSKKILFILNDGAPVSYSNKAYTILKSNNINKEIADSQIVSRISESTFVDNDSARYLIQKSTILNLELKNFEVYSYETSNNRYTRPNIDVIAARISENFDYIITLNKINISTNLFGSKLQMWYSLYDSEWSEIVSDKHKFRFNISEDIEWHAFIQLVWEPCESFEDKLLMIIDQHIEGYSPYGSSLPDLAQHKWKSGFLVTSDNDTLRGEVRYGDPYKVHYRLSRDSPSKLLTPGDIKYFISGERKYLALFIHQISSSLGKYAFAEIIAEGKVCLYKLGDHDSKKYYLRSDSTDKDLRVRFTPDKQRIINKDDLKRMFNEKHSAVGQIDDKNFGVKDLEKLVYLYNK